MAEILFKLSDFDYELPKELIAQNALPKRAEARLLILNRGERKVEHRSFYEIADYFERGDVLVLNDTKVLPARLFAKRKTGGRVEILVLGSEGGFETRPYVLTSLVGAPLVGAHNYDVEARAGTRPAPTKGKCDNIYHVLIKPSGRIRMGEELILSDGSEARVLDEADHETGMRRVQFLAEGDIESILNRIGRIPLPPYIDREDLPADRELYQTVFAQHPGAVASPTAGLHFDLPLLEKIETKGVEILFVTLHVGYGTFQPVTQDDLSQHKMYEEYFDVPDETAEHINFAKADDRRITACGTTVIRTLESAVRNSMPPEVEAKRGATSLFIYPPYEFKIADRMITNFHLPRTTLLMLTSAFAGHELLMQAYREAIERRCRFYSYGDAMLIL